MAQGDGSHRTQTIIVASIETTTIVETPHLGQQKDHGLQALGRRRRPLPGQAAEQRRPCGAQATVLHRRAAADGVRAARHQRPVLLVLLRQQQRLLADSSSWVSQERVRRATNGQYSLCP